MSEDDIRDMAIIIVDYLVDQGLISSAIDTDDSTEFDIQDGITDIIADFFRAYDEDQMS
jgi:hypothetical protein